MSRRGPNRSTRPPWNGEKNVCRTISSENVTWSVESATPYFAVSGLVNNVQTYWGLEIVIMQTRPNSSCVQRLWIGTCAAALLGSVSDIILYSGGCGPRATQGACRTVP